MTVADEELLHWYLANRSVIIAFRDEATRIHGNLWGGLLSVQSGMTTHVGPGLKYTLEDSLHVEHARALKKCLPILTSNPLLQQINIWLLEFLQLAPSIHKHSHNRDVSRWHDLAANIGRWLQKVEDAVMTWFVEGFNAPIEPL